MNEVNARRARLLLGWVTYGIPATELNSATTGMGDRLRAGVPSRYATSQLGQLSLASLQGRSIEYQLRLGLRRECRVAGNTVRSHVACEFP